ncbi:MAG: hypothetical protein R3B45_14295 [Bdellovibrionota bacterium]
MKRLMHHQQQRKDDVLLMDLEKLIDRAAIVIFPFLFIFFTACLSKKIQPNQLKPEKDGLETQVVQARTITPKSFNFRLVTTLSKDALRVPANVLELARVVRKKAEVRDGPNSSFLLQDQILDKDELVVVIDAIGVWKKVFAYQREITGWVHADMIENVALRTDMITIKINSLPVVVAVQPLNYMHTYPDRQKKHIYIRKGSQFIALKRGMRSVLVWLTETNSVAWLPQEFVK